MTPTDYIPASVGMAGATALRPISRYSNPPLAWVVALGGTMLISIVFFATGGNAFWSSIVIGAIAVGLVTSYDLELGFLLLIGTVLISDRFDVPGFRPFTYTIFYLSTLNVLIRGLSFGVFTTNELHIVFFVFVWILGVAFRRALPWRKVVFAGLAFTLLIFLIAWVGYGKSRGGDAQIGIWEIRALYLLVPAYLAVPQFVRDKKSLTRLMWVVILTLAFKAFQGIERFVDLGFTFEDFRTLTNHEDPLFFNTLFILTGALVVFNVRNAQRRALLFLTLPLLLGFYVGNRRATYASLGFAVLAFILLLSSEQRRRLMKWLAIFAVVFSVYLAAYWNSYGRAAMIAQAFKATVFYSDPDLADRGKDYMSGLVREHEAYNLAVTVRRTPILGIGFGNQHVWEIMTYGAFALKGYITHNAILWLLTKAGALGFLLFLLFLNCSVLLGAAAFSRARDPYVKSVAAMCVCAIINQTVGAYAEMQLINSRNMVYLGVLMGLIAAIYRLPVGVYEESGNERPGPLPYSGMSATISG